MSIYEYNEEKVMQALRKEAMEEGLEEGRKKVNELIKRLAAAERTDDILRAASEKEYQEQLFKEFGI